MALKIAAFVAICAASAGAAGAASTTLSGDVLRNAVSDNTVVLKRRYAAAPGPGAMCVRGRCAAAVGRVVVVAAVAS